MGAWGWVLVDMTVVFVNLGLMYPAIDQRVASGQMGEWVFIVLYLFLPLWVLSGGIIWARKSRTLAT